jgi:hypothetical protein
MSAITFEAMPPIKAQTDRGARHPLHSVFVTVLTVKLLVAAVLVATVSLAPPVSGEHSYVTMASR